MTKCQGRPKSVIFFFFWEAVTAVTIAGLAWFISRFLSLTFQTWKQSNIWTLSALCSVHVMGQSSYHVQFLLRLINCTGTVYEFFFMSNTNIKAKLLCHVKCFSSFMFELLNLTKQTISAQTAHIQILKTLKAYPE